MFSISTLDQDPVLTEASHDFEAAALGALICIRSALEAGTWTPCPDQDVETHCARIATRIAAGDFKADQPSAAPVVELCQMVLGAMEDGRWAPVTGDAVAAIQAMAFLADFICSDPGLF